MRELLTRPWLRAPVLLWRQPGLLLALAAASAVADLTDAIACEDDTADRLVGPFKSVVVPAG